MSVRTKLLCTILYSNPLRAVVCRFTCIFSSNLEFAHQCNDSNLFDSIEIPSQISFEIKWAKLSTFAKLNEKDAIHWLLLFTNMGWPFILCFHFEIFDNFECRHKFIHSWTKYVETIWNWIVAFVYSIDDCSVWNFSFCMLFDNNKKKGIHDTNALVCLQIPSECVRCSVFVCCAWNSYFFYDSQNLNMKRIWKTNSLAAFTIHSVKRSFRFRSVKLFLIERKRHKHSEVSRSNKQKHVQCAYWTEVQMMKQMLRWKWKYLQMNKKPLFSFPNNVSIEG